MAEENENNDEVENVPFDETEDLEEEAAIPESAMEIDSIASSDDDDDEDDDDEDRPKTKDASSDDSLLEANNIDAARANPKRAQIQRRSRLDILEGVDLDDVPAIHAIWNTLEVNAEGTKPRKYDMKSDDYIETDIIKHPQFGKGFVVEILSSTKISVLFEDGVRRLAVGRP